MTDVILSATESDNLMVVLERVHKESQAVFTLLNHSAGSTIAQIGEYPGPDSSMFSALSSAAYSSISSIIHSLGDEMFDSMNLRGKLWTFCILPVNPSAQLILIFKSSTLPTLSKTIITDWKIDLDNVLQIFGQTSKLR